MSSPAQFSDSQERMLVLLAQARDPGAFRELVLRYQRRILYFIRRILGDDEDALDVMQEVWLVAFRKLGSLGSADAFRVWLYTH